LKKELETVGEKYQKMLNHAVMVGEDYRSAAYLQV